MSRFAKEYLNFSRKDRIGVMIFTMMILSAYFLPLLTVSPSSPQLSAMDSAWIESVTKLENDGQKRHISDERQFTMVKDRNHERRIDSAGNRAEVFYFDPNTLSAVDWQRLGLRDKTIQTLRHYIDKGGRFRKAEDFRKVYGLRPELYKRLAPYIKIETAIKEWPATSTIIEHKKDSIPYFHHNAYTPIDINLADSNSFIALPGIGSRLATRIINFREKLGGFYRVEQVKETFGLQDSVFQKIKPYLRTTGAPVRKIDINNATKEELKMHPYIRWAVANAIVEYRDQHGNFTSIDDLKKIQIIEQDQFRKFAPYLSL